MNKIDELFQEPYMLKYFSKHLLPLFPEFSSIYSVRIIPYKKHVWSKTYHVVVQFMVVFEGPSGKSEREIFCSAHSNEPREEVLNSLNYLWDGGFSEEHLTIPKPLFFSERFKGIFYEGLQGDNLHYYLYKRNTAVVREMIVLTAKWFAKLHKFALPEKSFNEANSRIRTVMPGRDEALKKIKQKHPEYLDLYSNAYWSFVSREENFLSNQKKLWLIHGDAHPDNVIRTGEGRIGLIDFADLSVADFARDLGCFKQQLGYMARKEGYNNEEIAELEELFFTTYFQNSPEELSDSLQERIELYFNWTAMRTLSYLLLSGFLEKTQERQDRIEELSAQIKEAMSL